MAHYDSYADQELIALSEMLDRILRLGRAPSRLRQCAAPRFCPDR